MKLHGHDSKVVGDIRDKALTWIFSMECKFMLSFG